jgi:hypothetical protein
MAYAIIKVNKNELRKRRVADLLDYTISCYWRVHSNVCLPIMITIKMFI